MFTKPFSSVYKNGTYVVLNSLNGTKRYIGQEFKAEFPDSLDLKITEVCNHGCPFCHESSTSKGKHGDLETLLNKLKGLPKGVELAIGGGNALLHPSLESFLREVKDHFNVALTVNVKDFRSETSRELIKRFDKEGLIRALGVSLGDSEINKDLSNLLDVGKCNLSVYHVIIGVTPLESLEWLIKFHTFGSQRILILGYKQFGRASDKEISPEIIKDWKDAILNIYHSSILISGSFTTTLAFDNLALEQLGLKEHFNKDFWGEHYMGNEFTHSMYVDAVRGEYAPTSRSPFSKRVSWDSETVIEYFKKNHD